MSEESIIKLKNRGDVAFASGDYQHALNCYSLALKELVQRFDIDSEDGIRSFLSPNVFEIELSLLNKRSVVYVKTQNYKYALDDAKAIVNIRPMWFKGYLRVGDVQMFLGAYDHALKNYQMALRYLDSNENEKYEKFINHKIRDLLRRMQRQRIFDFQLPWLAAGLGLVIGMTLVTWDFVANPKNGYLRHPIIKLIVIAVCSFICFYLAQLQRDWNRKNKGKSFEKLVDEQTDEKEQHRFDDAERDCHVNGNKNRNGDSVEKDLYGEVDEKIKKNQ